MHNDELVSNSVNAVQLIDHVVVAEAKKKKCVVFKVTVNEWKSEMNDCTVKNIYTSASVSVWWLFDYRLSDIQFHQ